MITSILPQAKCPRKCPESSRRWMKNHTFFVRFSFLKKKFEFYSFLKQKLDYLFTITASKLPKFESWRTFSLVVAIVSKQKKLQRPVKKGAKIQT